jgi:hypothetical protein
MVYEINGEVKIGGILISMSEFTQFFVKDFLTKESVSIWLRSFAKAAWRLAPLSVGWGQVRTIIRRGSPALRGATTPDDGRTPPGIHSAQTQPWKAALPYEQIHVLQFVSIRKPLDFKRNCS